MQNTVFVSQFIIPAEPLTSWAGGSFFGKDRFVIWTLVGTRCPLKKKRHSADRQQRCRMARSLTTFYTLPRALHQNPSLMAMKGYATVLLLYAHTA